MEKQEHPWLTVAIDILNQHKFRTMRDTEEIYLYERGVYVRRGTSTIKELAKWHLQDKFSTKAVHEIIKWISYSTFEERENFNKDKNIINLENGLLDLKTLELKPHSAEHLSTIRVPVLYNPEADCPKIKKFMTEILRKEDIKKVLEFSGYLLSPSYHHHVIFLFVGGGRNGKSTFIELLRKFIGTDNCSSVSLQELQTNRFAAGSLYGKLLNAHPDISGRRLKEADILKALSGEDTIKGEIKFKNIFFFKNHARLLFAANTVPQIDDYSDAFYRRWEIVNFPNKFEETEDTARGVKKANKKLIDELCVAEELSGYLKYTLKAFQGLETQGHFTNKRSIAETAHEYKMLSTPVYAFINKHCEESPEGVVVKEDLFNEYTAYCKSRKLPPESEKGFVENLKRFVTVTESRPKINGERKYVWKGIKLKE